MKPLLLECQVKQTTRVNNINVNLTVGIAELVECVIDRCNTKPVFGINLPIDNIMPDYCEVRDIYHPCSEVCLNPCNITAIASTYYWFCIMCKPRLKCSLGSLARLSTLS